MGWAGFRQLLATVLVVLVGITASGCEVAQYNIANGNDDPGQTSGQNDIIWHVTSGWRPAVITLNEVCGHRFNQIRDAIARFGYSGVYDRIVPSGCGGNGYGSAIFHLGHRVGFAGEPDGLYVHHFARNLEPHHIHAMGVGIGAGSIRMIAWVTHLEASNNGVASAQAAELLDVVRYVGGATRWPLVVGGDFNLPPDNAQMRAWRSVYHEADGVRMRATHAAGKIDYLFSSIPWKGARLQAGQSDHKILIGGM